MTHGGSDARLGQVVCLWKLFLQRSVLCALMWMTLCVCVFAALAQEASSEENFHTAPPKKESPADQLIEFVINPPEKYDLGGMRITYWDSKEGDAPEFFRIKKEGTNIFNSSGIDDPGIMSRPDVGALLSYHSIWGSYDQLRWCFIGNSLTTWTNQRPLLGTNDPFYLGEESSINASLALVSLYTRSTVAKMQYAQSNQLVSVDSQNNVIGAYLYSCNKKGELSGLSLPFEEEVTIQSSTGVEKRIVGIFLRYSYTTNVGLSFFPNEMELYEIVEAEYPETIILETNKQVSYFFDHINITPVFDQSSFSVISTPQDNIRQYWVEGTNQVYIDKRTGVLKRVLSAEEAADLLIGREFKQKEYRKIYYFLVFLLVIGGVFFLPEKSKRYEK